MVIEEGRDAEYWAGHFGAEFSGERLYLELESLEAKNLHNQFQVRLDQMLSLFRIVDWLSSKCLLSSIWVLGSPTTSTEVKFSKDSGPTCKNTMLPCSSSQLQGQSNLSQT